MTTETGSQENRLSTLNLIGTGKLGSTLPRLLADAGLVRLQQLYNPNLDSARKAAAFIGSGTATGTLNELAAADFWLLAVPDGVIAETVAALSTLPLKWPDSIVFHCSGITSSEILQPLAEHGARIASLHPVHSFADPASSLGCFAGTFCSLEGHPQAVVTLARWTRAIGGQPLVIDRAQKALYHSAMTMASNNLVALLEVSVELLEKAGLPRDQSYALIAPLVRQTAENVFARGTGAALTGPVLRGDADTIARHVRAVASAGPELLETYRALSRVTLAIARQQQQQTASASGSGQSSADHLQQSMNLIGNILENIKPAG